MLALISLFAALAGDTVPGPVSPVGQSTAAPGMVVAHRQPSLPLVSLRLALLASDPPGYAGAGHLVQHLHYATLVDRVEQVGGRIQMARTPDAVVYTVTGPAMELDYLASVLRSTLRLPPLTPQSVRIGTRTLGEERLAEWETAGSHVRAQLRARIFPEDISAAGTDRSAARLTVGVLPDVWATMYSPERVAVVAVGDVELAEVEAAFSELPLPEGEPFRNISRDTVVLGQLAPAEATSGWVGHAYLATDQDPAALDVVARLLRGDLRRRLPEGRVEVEHWWTHHGQALALVVAVPGARLPDAQRAVGTALSSLEPSVDEASVRATARGIRRDMLFYSRTTERMAEVLGSFIDREGDPDALQRFYDRLERVSADDVRETLEALLEHTPVRVEVPPQRLLPPR